MALFVGAVQAQEPVRPASSPPARPPQTAVFPSEVDYVEVDAFVTDPRGNVVHGLTRDDFLLFEEGIRQEIAAFAEVAVPKERVRATPIEAAPPPRDTATNEEAVQGRIYAIVLDELHTDAQRSGAVRTLAREFIAGHMAEGDVAAVVFTGGGTDAAQTFTGDKRLLQEAVGRFMGRKLPSATLERLRAIEFQRNLLANEPRPEGAPPPPENRLAPRPGLERDPHDAARTHAARASMETLESVARGFAGVQGRRKAILFFSEGIDYDTLDVMGAVQRSASVVRSSMRETIATAARSSVAVYSIDPRGPVGPIGSEVLPMTTPAEAAAFGIDSRSLGQELRQSRDSLRRLAEETGGIAVVDTNDYATAYERIVRASSQYYLLGFYPLESKRDGAFRRIAVRVERAGLTVLAREGYVRPRAQPDEKEKPGSAAAAETSPELRALLDSPWPQPGLALGVTAAAFKGSGRDATVVVTIQLSGPDVPFEPQPDRPADEIELSLVAIDRQGRVRGGERLLARPSAESHEHVERAGLRFVRSLQLPPGRYQLRVAAREAAQGRRGSVAYDLEVPDYGNQELAMSGVLLASRTAALTPTPALDDVVMPMLRTPPTAGRRFEPGDVVTAYAEVYDAREPAHETAIATRVTSLDGREVFRTTRLWSSSELEQRGAYRHEVDIALTDVSPGQYLLQIAARPTLGEATVSRELSFEVVPVAAAADSATATAAPARRWDARRPTSRIDRLEAWLAAVESHEPGTADGPAYMVRSWTADELQELATDVAVVVRLIGDPQSSVMWLVDPTLRGRPQRAPYSVDDERRFRAMAREAAERGPGARNRLLKRGAVLHTDAAIRVGMGYAQPRGAGEPRSERWQVRFSDGQQQGAEQAPGHWELARALLDNVQPDPMRDETVRLWYLATSAFGQHYEQHTRQEDRAVELFPGDANLLLLAGSFHETFASPRMQSLARSIRLPSGVSHGIGAEQSELREAEKLLRRALEAQPALVEARIRLGRVLYRLGRHEAAARELQQAVAALSSGGSKAADDDGLLRYYAEMFLGAARESLGRNDSARVSYARAAALYPDAPSPRLALSQLAFRGNDRAAALDAVQRALRPEASRPDRDDPWWRYHVVQGRRVDAWFDELHRSLAVEP